MNKDTEAQITYFDFLLQSSLQYYQENLDKKLLYIFELYIKSRIADDYTVIEDIDVNHPVLNETFQDDMLKSLNNNLKNNIKKYTTFYLLEYILLIMDALTNNQEWKKKSEEYIKIDQTMGNLAIELLNPTYIKDITKNFTTFPQGFPILSKKVSTPKDIYSPNRSPGSTPPSTPSPISVGVGGGDKLPSYIQVGGNMHAPFKEILEKIAEIKHDFGHDRGCIKEFINGVRNSSHIDNIIKLTNEPSAYLENTAYINQLIQPTPSRRDMRANKKIISIEKILNSSDLELLMFNTFFTILDLNVNSPGVDDRIENNRAEYLQKFIFMSSKGSMGTTQYAKQLTGDAIEQNLVIKMNELMGTYLDASNITNYVLDASIANQDTSELRNFLSVAKSINIRNIPATLWDRARSVAPEKQATEMGSFFGKHITGECNNEELDARRQYLRSKYTIGYLGPDNLYIHFCEAPEHLSLKEGFSVNQLSIALYHSFTGERLDSAKLQNEFLRIPEEDKYPINNLIKYIDTYIPDPKTRIQLLFDLKKIGDWNQVLWVKKHQDHLFWTGDRLCALYSILNDNKTLFGGKIFDDMPLLLGYYRGSSPLTVGCIIKEIEFIYSLFSNEDGSNTFFNEDRNLKEPAYLFGDDGTIPGYKYLGKTGTGADKTGVTKLFLKDGKIRKYYTDIREKVAGGAGAPDSVFNLNTELTFIKNFFTLISEIKKISQITPTKIWEQITTFKNIFISLYAIGEVVGSTEVQKKNLASLITHNTANFAEVISQAFPRGRTASKIINKFQKWDGANSVGTIIDELKTRANTPELFSYIFDFIFKSMDIQHIFVELPIMYYSIIRQSETILASSADSADTDLKIALNSITKIEILRSCGDFRDEDERVLGTEEAYDMEGKEFGNGFPYIDDQFVPPIQQRTINPDQILHEISYLNDGLSELYRQIENNTRLDKIPRDVQTKLENLERDIRKVDTFSKLIQKLVS